MLFNKKTALLAVSLVLLASCGKDRLVIDGQKISVFEEKKTIVPDYTAGDIEIVLPTPKAYDTWSQTGGNASHNMGHIASHDELKKLWSKNFGSGNSKRDYLIASPVIAEGLIFTIDTEAEVRAFAQKDGKSLWNRRLKPQIKTDKDSSLKGAGLAYDNKMVYATTGFGGVFGINSQDGKVKWNYFTKTPIRIAPVAGNNKVFVQTIDNTIIALNATTGSEIWRYTATAEDTTLVGGAAPAYSEDLDLLVVGFSNGELRAIKASTGSPLWSDFLISNRRNLGIADINAIRANPVIAGNMVYAVGSNNMLVAIDARSGQRQWEREIGSNNQPWIAGKYIFLLTNTPNLIAVQADSGKVIWDTKIPAGNGVSDKVGVAFAGPILTNDRLLVNTSNGFVFSVSPYTGSILGFIKVDDGSSLPPIAANGQVVITTNDADIVVYE